MLNKTAVARVQVVTDGTANLSVVHGLDSDVVLVSLLVSEDGSNLTDALVPWNRIDKDSVTLVFQGALPPAGVALTVLVMGMSGLRL